MYSSRHNHALRRSREGSGRFVGGPVESLAMTSVTSSVISSQASSPPMPSSLTPSCQSDLNSDVTSTLTTANNFLPFSQHQIQTPQLQEPHQTNSESNTNNNNHTITDEGINVVKPRNGEGVSVANTERRGTVITSLAIS